MESRCQRSFAWRLLQVAVGVAWGVLAAFSVAGETNPDRAPTGKEVTAPDLLKEADGLEFRFGYFPSLNQLRMLVLREPRQYTRWEVVVSAKGKSEALARQKGRLPFPQAGETLTLPPLGDGVYEITLTLLAEDGVGRELRRTFERKHFAWEGNRLGQDRVIVPPFTPLEVTPSTPVVKCVLREHELDGTGLWKQVLSQGRALLASPMRLEITAAGKTHVARGGQVAFAEKSADRVRGSAAWAAGPVQGSTQFDFDYDGTTKVTMELLPVGTRVESLRLVIPMKTDETWLMHPVTDLLRFHYAGRIPNGKNLLWDYGGKRSEVRYTQTGEPDANGKVWDSSHVGRWQLPGPFVPYMWLGGPERGIAWFAENDRDWSLATDKPTLEIRREGQTTSLVVHMITKPVTLSRPRKLVFGLMATPAKPMPETPVNHRRWWPGPPMAKAGDVVGMGWMGSCYYWGAAGPCTTFYPAFQNFTVYDEFARLRSGGAVRDTYTDDWLAQFRAPEFQQWMPTYRAHINWSVHFLSGDRWKPNAGRHPYVLPYTNARAANWGDEMKTFVDEWSTLDIADPRWPGEERFLRTPGSDFRLNSFGKLLHPDETLGISYAIDPVPSWQDMVLFYCRRMLDTFADGIYFDDYFLSPNYNPLGPGYVDDEGKLHAGVNLFAFHDLTKRLATIQHQSGRRPMVFIHMTNANIVPILSFATLLLDHEWRDQGDFRGKDCQERFYLDDDTSMLLTQSTGLQSGCLGIVHNLFHIDPRLARTALGVALTHEMRLGVDGGPPGEAIGELLCRFGYGLPDCRTWRYWDEPLPIKTSGAAAKTLVLARNGKAIVVIASYGPAGDAIVDLDLKTLGLPPTAVASNAETNQPIEQLAPGRFKIALPRHDFRILQIGAAAPGKQP